MTTTEERTKNEQIAQVAEDARHGHKPEIVQRCFPGGRTVEIQTPHAEWTEWAVRAVNNHDALVEALKFCVQAMRTAGVDSVPGGICAQAAEEARAALSKAGAA